MFNNYVDSIPNSKIDIRDTTLMDINHACTSKTAIKIEKVTKLFEKIIFKLVSIKLNINHQFRRKL